MHADDKSLAPADEQRLVDQRFRASAPYWSEIYRLKDVYAFIHQQRREVALALVDSLRLPAASRILELGCGAGSLAVALAERGYRVAAVDTVDSMLNLARGLAWEAGVGERVIVSRGDAHNLAFGNDTFDLVVALGVVPYLHSVSDALGEVVRVLKPGGHFIANADNRWRLNHVLDPMCFPPLTHARRGVRKILEQLGLRKPSAVTVRPRVHSLAEFDRLLRAACLEVRQGKTLGFGPFSLFKFRLLPDRAEIKLQKALQSLADRGYPLLRSVGAQYVVLAENVGSPQRSGTA